ncbi:MAG: amidohydrolase family protein [Lentisphaeria bacterium]|nr:amidohydrolase family protein [Lentisphaeria bacterium]
MIIDFHTHFYPEKVAEKAMAHCQGLLQVYSDGTRKGLLDSMGDANVDLSVGLALVNNPENSASVNRWAAQQNHGPICMAGSFHPAESDPVATIRAIANCGMRGVKVHPEYQQFSFEDKTLYPCWEECSSQGLFLITHAGFDIMYHPPWHTSPRSLAQFHKNFPKLTLVLAHLGSMTFWDEVEKELAGLPVFFDLAFVTPEYISREQLVRIIRRHGAERILFGTDAPWCSQKKHVEWIDSLPLGGNEKAAIFYKNAAGLLKLEN